MDRSQSSSTDSDRSDTDSTYCVFLRIFEAVGVVRPSATVDARPLVLVTVTLNGVKFEVEGQSTELSTIFNSNCIWECDLKDLRRMRSDNRPIKLECFLRNCEMGNSGVRMVGSMLLPIRNVALVSQQRGLQINMHWHKLSTLHSEWRQTKPEVLLYLTIVKKDLIEGGQLLDFLDTKKQPSRGSLSPMSSETSMMLRSQSNIYVQLLDQVGLIQVGNNPDVDCDIITVWMKMHQLRNVRKLVEFEQGAANAEPQKFLFHFNLLGTVWNKEFTANADDMYLLGNKISLSFKSSVRSLRLYFQRIFYIPVVLYHNGHIIANFRFDFNKYMPADEYFSGERNWVHNGTFHFDRLHKALSPHLVKPSVDFVFKFTLVTVHSNKMGNAEGDHFVRPRSERDFLDGDSATSRMELTRRSEMALSVHTSRAGAAASEYIVVNTTAFESTEDDLCGAAGHTEGGCMPHAADLRSYLLNSHLPKPPTTASIGTSVDAALVGDEAGDSCPPTTRSVASVATGMDPVLTCEVALCTERVETVSVATETDAEAKNAVDSEELTLKVVRELEEWKALQMECFVQQLERKKAEYLAGVKLEWKRHRNVMQARFEAEAEEAVQAQLLALQPRRDDLLKSVQQEIEQQYAGKFEALERQIERLKVDMHEKSTSHALQQKDMQLENSRLRAEKRELEHCIESMRQKLVFMEKTTMSSGDLKKVLADLRLTNERYAKLEKSKNDYQQLWTKATRDVKRLKMDAQKEKERAMREKTGSSGVGDFELSIEELLSDEHEALRSDRSELEAIKDILLETCGPEEDL